MPSPLPVFPATNWWNLDISAAPVDGNSANFINFIGGGTFVHPDFGGTDGTTYGIYGMPYIVVNGTQPKLTVDFVEFPTESDNVGYPIPMQAITTPHWIEGGEPGDLAPGGDRHMLIVDYDNKLLYELYHAHYNGTNWEAGSGAFWDMKTNNRRPVGWTSADAAGLAIFPGLVRYDEAYLEPGPIKHAFRVTVQQTNGYVYPGSHNAGSTAGALPMGGRLRLKASKTVSSSDTGVQRIVQALKTYGLIVADNGSDMYIGGTFDDRWDNGILNPALGQLHASDFEVVQLGYGSNLADLQVTKTDGQTTVFSGSPVTYTITVTNNGPNAVTGASVVDTFPAALLSPTWTCSASAGSSCGAASGTGNINRLVNLLIGGTVTFTASATIDPTFSGTLSNTATAAVPGGMSDPVPANNSATDTDTVLAGADLSITKTDGRTTASPSDAIIYTIVVSNAGPNAATGATVTDNVPAALTGATWTCVGTAGTTCTAGPVSGNINDTVTLPVAGSVTYTLTGTVGINPANLRNTATVAPPSGMGDPNPGNNSATDDDTLLCFGETVVVPDGRLASRTIGASADLWFAASVKIGNWYSIEFKNTSGTSTPGTLMLFRGDDGCSMSSTAAPADTSAIDPAGTSGITRVSFGASGTQTFFRAKLHNGAASPIPFSFSWSDTTMYSPAWSTNGGFNTFYSFQNTTGTSLVGTLTLLDTNGLVVSTVFPVTVPAGQTASVNTASLGTTRNRTGTARFTHNGPPGAILAESAIASFSINPAYVQPVKFQAPREAR